MTTHMATATVTTLPTETAQTDARLLALLMDSVSDGVLMLTPLKRWDYRLTQANRTLAGLAQRSLVGCCLSQLLSKHDFWRLRVLLRRVETDAQPMSFKAEVMLGGSLHVMKVRLLPLRENGQTTTIVGVLKVLTQHAKAQREYRTLRNRFAAAFEYAPYGVCFVAPTRQPLMVNRALCRMLGLPLQRLTGQLFEALLHPEDQPLFTRALAKVFSGQRAYDGIELRLLNAEGAPVWVSLSMSLAQQGDAESYVIIQLVDIGARKENEAELLKMATQDHLTGAANRMIFDRTLESAVANAQRYGRKGAIVFIDMDDFKSINDTFGHKVGDRALQEVSRVLKQILRGTDLLARIGGDEFAVILEEADEIRAAQKATLIRNAIGSVRLDVGQQRQLTIQASVGVKVFDGSHAGQSAEAILVAADQAMYAEKVASKRTRLAS